MLCVSFHTFIVSLSTFISTSLLPHPSSPLYHLYTIQGAARDPNNAEAQEALRKAAEDLRNATNAAANDALKKKLIKKLEVAAKQTAASATQCIAAAQGATPTNRNQSSQQQLLTNCKTVADHIGKLVQVRCCLCLGAGVGSFCRIICMFGLLSLLFCLTVCMYVCLSVCPFVRPSVCLCIYMFNINYLSVYKTQTCKTQIFVHITYTLHHHIAAMTHQTHMYSHSISISMYVNVPFCPHTFL